MKKHCNECPLGGDIENDCADCVYGADYHFVDGNCIRRENEVNFENFTPSWYIYSDCDGEFHTEAFGQISESAFFTKVSYKICFDDLDRSTVHKIFYKGKEVEYVGWQRGMKFEYKDLAGNTIWVGYFEDWDH